MKINLKNVHFANIIRSVHLSIVDYYLYFLVTALSLGIFITSYTGKKATEILSFKLADSHCKIGIEGVGNHCFGDFYYSLNYALAKNPWNDNVNMYPPVSNLFFKPFSLIREYIAIGNLSLIIYFMICFGAIVFMIRNFATWYRLDKFWTACIFVFIFTSAPILAAIDRGNNQLFLLPMIYLFYKNCLLEDDRKAFWIGTILVLFKPHFIFLGFYFLRHKSLKKFFKWNLLGGTASLVAFLLYPSGILVNLQTYVQKLNLFQNYVPAGTLEVPNLSLPNTIGVFERLSNIFITGNDIFLENRKYPGLIFTFSLLALTLVAIRVGRDSDTKLKTLLFCTLIPLSLPNVVFGYYLVGLLPFFLIYSTELKRFKGGLRSDEPEVLGFNRSSSFLICALLIFGFIPWQIPWSVLPLSAKFDVGDISFSWFLAQLSLAGLLFSLMIPSLVFGVKELIQSHSPIRK